MGEFYFKQKFKFKNNLTSPDIEPSSSHEPMEADEPVGETEMPFEGFEEQETEIEDEYEYEEFDEETLNLLETSDSDEN